MNKKFKTERREIKMTKTIIDDGFAAYLVEGAEFDGLWEIPIINGVQDIETPKDIIPFDKKRLFSTEEKQKMWIHFYMHDTRFRPVITNTAKYLPELSQFGAVISPDCSLYVDMPLGYQLGSKMMNHAVGHFMEYNGVTVIPNVRWGDERTFEFCFQGFRLGGVFAISTLGCIRSNEEKRMFRLGLEKMIEKLRPKKVIVNGVMPVEVFSDFEQMT
ncbi:MAG: DUF4417 domain-containing protein, partial [Gallicola sp.]|nr:DUF4417 domain-containing protein [Gallicola sp.]